MNVYKKNKSKLPSNYVVISLIISIFFFSFCSGQTKKRNKSSFSIAFLTDIHLQPGKAVQGFKQAIESVNKQNPDFVITGGDLVMDANSPNYEKAESLYDLYQKTCENFKMPVHNTIGNHELYGTRPRPVRDSTNPEYAEKMFEKRFGKSYYSFVYKGWKFMILNSIEDTRLDSNDTKRFIWRGIIDSTQMEWIKSELANTNPLTPIVISTHIPFITAWVQRLQGTTIPIDSSLVIVNSKEVIDLFKGHNLRLVLQGHLHNLADVFIDGIHFLTGGAVCGSWWKGPGFMDTKLGYLLLNFEGDQFKWKYVDYGWDPKLHGQ